MKSTWLLKKFKDLTLQELYAILQLRNVVFSIEQNCIYPDMDDKDQLAAHLMCFQNGNLAAYTRILPSGISYPEPSIGRVVTAFSARRTGLGKELLRKSIDACINLYGNTDITLSAQLYLKVFYETFGFKSTGDVYLEDDIEHIKMTRRVSR